MYPNFFFHLEMEENPVRDRMNRHEVLVLRQAGLTCSKVAGKTGGRSSCQQARCPSRYGQPAGPTARPAARGVSTDCRLLRGGRS